MLLAHHIRLDPNNVQASYLTRAAGTARFAFNWGLAEWERQYQAWKVNSSLALPTEAALRRQLNAACAGKGVRVHYPELHLCTDNGAMIAMAAAMRLQTGVQQPDRAYAFDVKPRWPLAEIT